jgi:hypothetical protein
MKHVKALLVVGFFISPAVSALGDDGSSDRLTAESECEVQSCPADADLLRARAYLIETARPGGTMMRQGSELAIERLHPEFAKRLADAIRAARSAALVDAGIFSAYRPPVFGVGGFADKYYSLHAYGLAVDMYGIGRPGSMEAQQWHEIAAEHGIVCPYGYRNRREWNHCQPTHLAAVRNENPLRATITGSGPIDLESMFETGNNFIADVQSTLATVVADRVAPAIHAVRFRSGLQRRRGQRSHFVGRNSKISRAVARHSRSGKKPASLARASARSSRAKLALLAKRPK